MDNFDIINQQPERIDMIRDITKKLDEANKAYYMTAKPIMTDAEYDELERLYQRITGNKYDKGRFIKNSKSNKRLVDTKHTFENLLTTIDNKFQNLDELNEWLDNIYEELNLKSDDELTLLVTEKYDGNSLCIEYDENGKAVAAPTRGADGKGKNLIDIFKDDKINNPFHKYMGIKYEVMLSYENFNKLNDLKIENNESLYANPRNTVAGILARDDAYKFRPFLTPVPLSIRVKDTEINREEEIDEIFEIYPNNEIEFTGEEFVGNLKKLKSSIKKMYDEYTVSRETMPYMIDGLVVELTETKYKNKLKYFTNGSPKWQAAVKFPCMQKESTVEDIVFEVSPNGTGKITPSVIFKPVIFNGATMKKVSLANYKRFKELSLAKDDRIQVELRNDVLCYVNKLSGYESTNDPIPFTKTCPECGSKVIVNKEETFAYCTNEKCPMKVIGRINHYFDMVGIKGIDVSTIRKIYDANLLNSISDIYKLKYPTISKIVGDKTAMNIIDAINENEPSDYEVIAGLGIKNLGKDSAKILLSKYTIQNLLDTDLIKSNKFKDSLVELEGIGKTMADYISDGLYENNLDIINIMANVNIKATNYKKADDMLTFVITGDTDPNYFKDRNAVRDYIESKGHKLTSAISKRTNYLITENTGSGTKKNKDAKSLGVKIITCKELKEMLG